MDLHNRVALISLEHFRSLPKTGKPNNQEWTILSTIVMHNSITNSLEVVSLGTGSKCIGSNSMSPKGDILNDSHAEIVCRRAFLRYLFYEIECFLKTENETTIFLKSENNKLLLRDTLSFHLFSTHIPCGDAAIFPKEEIEDFGTCILQEDTKESSKNAAIFPKEEKEDFGICLLSTKEGQKNFETRLLPENTKERSKNNQEDFDEFSNVDELEIPRKKIKIDPDIFRTGAKCLENDIKQDAKQTGAEYHTTGAIRTKPGRGNPTLSVSCSDKIARWTYVGVQGALLSILLEKPVYLSSITIAANVPFSEESLSRAIYKRFDKFELPAPYKQTVPQIAQSNLSFEFSKVDSKQPCPSSIIWYKNSVKVEVAVEGKKQGVTKKNRDKKIGRLQICKKELFSVFINVISNYQYFKMYDYCKSLNYLAVKSEAVNYKTVWSSIKDNIFKIWTHKNNDLLKFDCND